MEHPDTIQCIFNLAILLRDKGDHVHADPLYRRVVTTYEKAMKKGNPLSAQFIRTAAACHNNIAFHTEVPAKNWREAEFHYRKSIELFGNLQAPLEADNVELNLQILFHLSGEPVDLARVKELTRILEEVGDKRAEKGHKLVKELS